MTDDPDTIGPDGSVRLRGAAAQVLRDEREAARVQAPRAEAALEELRRPLWKRLLGQ